MKVSLLQMLKTGLMSKISSQLRHNCLMNKFGQLPFEDESSDNEEDGRQDEKIVLKSEAVECFKKCLS